MLERMQKVYTDKSYEDPQIIKMFKNFEKKINVNASTLVIVCINKLYQIMLQYGCSLVMTSLSDDSTKSIRRLFVHVNIICYLFL